MIWDSVPVPSVADPTESRMMTPKSLLECCCRAQEYVREYGLGDGLDVGELNMMRVVGHRTRANTSPTLKRQPITRTKSATFCVL